MSALLFRLGRSSARHPFRVLGLWLAATVVVVALQGAAGGEFDDSFRVPGVESQRPPTSSRSASRARAASPPASSSTPTTVGSTTPARPGPPSSGVRLALAGGHDVTGVTEPAPQPRRADRLRRRGVRRRQARRTSTSTTRSPPPTPLADAGVQTELTGALALLGKDDPSSELIGIGVAIIVLLVAFGSVVAMGLPIVTALVGLFVGAAGVGVAVGRHRRPRVLADPLHDGRPRRRHRLRAVHRHPAPPEPRTTA